MGDIASRAEWSNKSRISSNEYVNRQHLSMRFKFIDTLGLQVNLSALNRDSQPYSFFLYQHEGNLQADDVAIKNYPSVQPQLQAVIEKALEINADLVLTPEYSCPWGIVSSIIANKASWPRPGKLWVLGCESISKAVLSEFQQSCSRDDVYLYFEPDVLQKNGNYLDPLVYLFRAEHEHQDKLIVLIQFKTAHMGVWASTIERDNLIEGEEIFILQNSASSIHLLSLICSEAMNFPAAMTPLIEDFHWADMPYLILNPQLNPNPTHPRFAEFRRFVSNYDRKELISLNWATSATLMGHPLTPNHSSRSGFFLKSHEVDLTHDRIKHNHHLGMYYFSLSQQKHAYILNSRVHAFLIRNMAISITANHPEQQRRDGPRVTNIFLFNGARDVLENMPDGVTDYHVSYLSGVHCSCAFLLNPANCVMEKEMLVSLTTANVSKALGADWSNVQHLFALQSNEQTEPNNRITFTEDTFPGSIRQRTNYIDTISKLDLQILPRPDLFPESIRDLANSNLRIGYHANARRDAYRYNVINQEGHKKNATLCYLGSAPDPEINRKFDLLQGMFDNDNLNRGRVVIFYSRGENILSKSDPSAGRIGCAGIYEPTSIFK